MPMECLLSTCILHVRSHFIDMETDILGRLEGHMMVKELRARTQPHNCVASKSDLITTTLNCLPVYCKSGDGMI